MAYDPRQGYGHMEKWFDLFSGEWVGTYEWLGYPYDNLVCPKCGGKLETWEGQIGEAWDGRAEYAACEECHKCDIHSDFWDID